MINSIYAKPNHIYTIVICLLTNKSTILYSIFLLYGLPDNNVMYGKQIWNTVQLYYQISITISLIKLLNC